MTSIADRCVIKNKELDRRVKLTDEQREEIISLYQFEIKSTRRLARMFGVNRTTIRNVVNPEKYKRQLEKYKKEKHSRKYYDREKNTLAQREHRAYKLKLFKKGLIKFK